MEMYIKLDGENYLLFASDTPLEGGLPEPVETPVGFALEDFPCYRYAEGMLTLDEAKKAERAAEAGAAEARAVLDQTRTGRVMDALLPMLAPEMADAVALTIADAWPEWKAETAYGMGQVVRHQEIPYRVVMAHTSQAHQQPGGEGMLAMYRRIQTEAGTDDVLPWLSGEEVAPGERRAYQGAVYQCIAPGGAGINIYPPDQVPSVWEKVA